MKQILQTAFSLCLSFSLVACEPPPRFAPPPIETTRPTRPTSDVAPTETSLGFVPSIPAPSLRCMKVSVDGRLEWPSATTLSNYSDDIACIVRLPKAAGYETVSLFANTATNSVLLKEALLTPRPDGTVERLLWLPVSLWREAIQDPVTIEAKFPCDEAGNEEGFTCDLTLSQFFTVSTYQKPVYTEPKNIKGKGPLLSEIQCNSYDAWGFVGGTLIPGDSVPEEIRCELFFENPLSEALQNVLVELRVGPAKGSSRVVASRLFPRIEPQTKLSTQLHVPLSSLSGAIVVSGHIGRNATERGANKQSIALQTTTEAPATQPTSAPTEEEPPTD